MPVAQAVTATIFVVFVAVAVRASARVAAAGAAASTGADAGVMASVKLCIEVENLTVLYALNPDLTLISNWSKENGVSGCYVYCRLADHSLEGRNFNHINPALEDAATGVAAGALTEILGHGIILRQGYSTGKSCRMVTSIEGNKILVGGKVERP